MYESGCNKMHGTAAPVAQTARGRILGKLTAPVAQLAKKFVAFYSTCGSSPSAQQPATVPHVKRHQTLSAYSSHIIITLYRTVLHFHACHIPCLSKPPRPLLKNKNYGVLRQLSHLQLLFPFFVQNIILSPLISHTHSKFSLYV